MTMTALQSIVLLVLTLPVWQGGDKGVASAIRRIPSLWEDYERHLMEDDEEEHEDDWNSTAAGAKRRRVTVNVPSSPDDHLVKSLPLLDHFPTKHWAGLLPASLDGDKYFFYWLFAPDMTSVDPNSNLVVDEKDVPLLIWLNGGPGCSSMDGLFLENGPLRFVMDDDTKEWKLTPAEYSWHKAPAYTLYIDQPVGTGLSFTTSRNKYPTNDKAVNEDFYFFLQQFLQLHADKFVTPGQQHQVVNRPFFFSGESHAGHYIPSMMAHILNQNEKNKTESIYIPLSGAAIGNGWVDPVHQYAAAKAAYGKGIIGRAQLASLDMKEKQCQQRLLQKRYVNSVCFRLLDDVVDQSQGNKHRYHISQYDARKMEDKLHSRIFPPGHKVVETYLGGAQNLGKGKMDDHVYAQVLQALHAAESREAKQVYKECTDPPYNALSHQDGLGVVPEVVRLLQEDQNIRMFFFNGVEDMICNHVGNEITLEELPWKHQTDWILAQRSAWQAASHKDAMKVSGYVKSFQNLIYLKVLNSGHMVPMDVPDVALDMIRVFMFQKEGAFQSNSQNLPREDVQHDKNGQVSS